MKSSPYEDLVGTKIESWTILEILPLEHEVRLCFCKCKCGKIQKNRCSNLINGKSPKECIQCSRNRLKQEYTEFLKEKNIGKKFNRWTILDILPSRNNRIFCRCQCECSTIREIRLDIITKGGSFQCRKCSAKNKNLIHGFSCVEGSFLNEYKIYHGIKQRCYNKNSTCYPHYGGRGIKMSDRWLSSVTNFIEDMGRRPSKKHSIDRINTNGDYCTENCKWSIQKEQVLNRRKISDMQKEIDDLKRKLSEK